MKDENRKAMYAKHYGLIKKIRPHNDFFKSTPASTICRKCGKKTTHDYTHECVGCGIRRTNEQKCMFCKKRYIDHYNSKHEFVGE